MKLKRWLQLTMLLLLLVGFIIRFVQINTTYPIGRERSIAFGETETSRKGLEYTISDAYFVPYDEMAAIFNAMDPEHEEYTLIPGEEIELIMIEMEVHNPTEEEMGFGLPTDMESAAWTNGMDVIMFYFLNPENDGVLTAGETTTVKMPFEVRKMHFPAEQWETVRERTYYLTLSLVPEIVKMQLPYMGDR